VVNATPRPLYPQQRGPVPIAQEAWLAPGPVWACMDNFALTGIRSPDRPAPIESLYRLRHPSPPNCPSSESNHLLPTTNYPPMPSNNPEERRPHMNGGRSLKSHMLYDFVLLKASQYLWSCTSPWWWRNRSKHAGDSAGLSKCGAPMRAPKSYCAQKMMTCVSEDNCKLPEPAPGMRKTPAHIRTRCLFQSIIRLALSLQNQSEIQGHRKRWTGFETSIT
jgi:hypothetical protein